MNLSQKAEFELFLLTHTPAMSIPVLHHGDCIGSDEQADEIAISMGWKIVVHPPINPKNRAWCENGDILQEKDYLVRNHDIVDACEVLVAAPTGDEIGSSGTWATIRYARKQGKLVVILEPN